MAIRQITTNFTGEVDVFPRLVRIDTDDSYSAVTAANYLKNANKLGFTFYPSDLVELTYDNNVTKLFTLTITTTTITLIPLASNVTLPVTSGNIAMFSGTTGVLANGPVAANRVLTAAFDTPDVSSNMVSFDVQATAALLASGGIIELIASSGSKQYVIRSLQLNAGTNFSGGGGDRNLIIYSDLMTYSSITDTTLAAAGATNVAWGSSDLPFPSTDPANTATPAGGDLLCAYSGGTADFAAGLIRISGLAQRIA